MRHLFLFLTLTLLICSSAFSQKKIKNRTIVDFEVNIDTLALDALENNFRFGIKAKLHNGKTKYTKGLNNGSLNWSRFNIIVGKASRRLGTIHYFPNDFSQKDTSRIALVISPKNNPKLQKMFFIEVPKLESFKVTYDKNSYLSPGFEIPLKIIATYTNKKQYTTNDSIGNMRKVKWKNFEISYLGRNYEQNFVYVPKTVNKVYDKVDVMVAFKDDKNLTAKTSIPINYKAPYVFNFNGENGDQGSSGSDASGRSGKNGRDGYDGYDGSNGNDGHDLKLYITTLKMSNKTLLKLKAVSKSRTKSLIFNSKGGNLLLQCNGGRGGKGGEGGCGSKGADETAKESAGRGGNGGDGGRGGRGGDGGDVTVYMDEDATRFYKEAITIQNRGGYGGDGGNGGPKGRGGYVNTDDNKTLLGKLLTQAVRGGGGKRGNEGRAGNTGREGEDVKYKVLTIEKKAKIFSGFVKE